MERIVYIPCFFRYRNNIFVHLNHFLIPKNVKIVPKCRFRIIKYVTLKKRAILWKLRMTV